MDSIVLKNNIPFINYKSNQLIPLEKKLSKFFKCSAIDSEKCFWTGNNALKFRKHLNKHKKVYCFYCKFDGLEDNIEYFDDNNYDQLIQHLLERHGFRCFQCNRCQYRAITSTHIHLHQISAHFQNWSNNKLVDNFDSINETNIISNICKIIVCKKLCFDPSVHHSIWMKKFAPKLDPNVSESEYHCLLCDYNNENVFDVYIHCVENHCDFDICVWHKKSNQIQSFINNSEKSLQNNSDNYDSNRVLCKPLHNWKKTFDSQPKDIPGLEENFKPPLKRQSYEPFDDDYYEMTSMDISDTEEYSQQRVRDDRQQIYDRRNSQMKPNIEMNRNNLNNQSINSNRSENSIKRSLSNSDMSSVKRYNNQTSPSASRSIPPPIDLESIEPQITSELINSSPTNRKNTFKNNNKRISHSKGVNQNSPKKPANSQKSNKISYIERNDKESDDYLELISESEPHIPKKGMKARFENRSFYEPIAISKSQLTFNEKNIFRCLICKIDNLRNNKIAHHLLFEHKTTSSFKCGYCEFIGLKHEIREHLRLKHPTSEDKIEKFIVSKSQDKAIGITSTSRIERPIAGIQATARKRTNGQIIKGALTQKIKESTFLGPLKEDKTVKKKQIERNDQTIRPFIRVKPRMPHSSNIKPKQDPKPCVAKKSTARRSANHLNDSQRTIVLAENEIPNKYFCVFCSEGFIINSIADAIEHYKTHLKLGYKCGKCHYFVISYDQMEYHMNSVHPNEEIDIEDNMTEPMRLWILGFLNKQIENSDFCEEDMPTNSCGINIECPLCVKASIVCKKKARQFEALWQVKLHLCKHFYWMPMKCLLCQTQIMFPNNPFLLIKHLIGQHFTSTDNLYNQSFRGQKAYNDIKPHQFRAIDKYYCPLRVDSSDIIDSFFQQLMDELDVVYENQLKSKFNLDNEIRIPVERLVYVKNEPIDNYEECDNNDDDIDEKKDFKSGIKTEIKSEIKTEMKEETKDESDSEEEFKTKSNLHLLYGEDNDFIPQFNRNLVPKNDSDIECLTLSSDEES